MPALHTQRRLLSAFSLNALLYMLLAGNVPMQLDAVACSPHRARGKHLALPSDALTRWIQNPLLCCPGTYTHHWPSCE